MDFDIVIATRNRLVALQLSIPLMLQQKRLPKKFIIVDSSENSEAVELAVRALFDRHNTGTVMEFHRSAAGTCIQRNFGLARVESPVVFFPDDDSIWFPGFTEAIMQVYERDTECAIAGICGAAAIDPPPGFFAEGKSPGYKVARRDRSKFIEPLSDAFERLFLRDSFSQIGQSKTRRHRQPDWLPELDVVLCDFMTGFRMTFRTEILRQTSFDELLGSYALYEDREASLGVLDHGLLVCATRARVYHHRVPTSRTSGYEWGVMQVLNRAYIVCKHTDPGDVARRGLRRYILYRFFRYVLQSHSSAARKRIKGLRHAWHCLPDFEMASKSSLPQVYSNSFSSCLESKPPRIAG
jgi:glycosyltransferase involved in cell wall biosynthesis